MQKCRCEEKYENLQKLVDCPNGYLLCLLCASAVAGGTSRWSWLACEDCQRVNTSLLKRFKINLPLGRHSIMNGITIPFKRNASVIEAGTRAVIKMSRVQLSLSDWGNLRARELFESVDKWRDREYISVNEWEEYFPTSHKWSIQACKDFFGVKHLTEIHLRFKAGQ